MNNQIKNEVANRVPGLGDSEFRLAYSRVTDKNNANQIVDAIEEFRKPFAAGKTANLGSANFATAAQWDAIGRARDDAAKRELLKASADLAELDALESKAKAAREAAEAKQAELNRDWNLLSAIPERIRRAEHEARADQQRGWVSRR